MLITPLALALAPLLPGFAQERPDPDIPWIVRTQSEAGWWQGDGTVDQAGATALMLLSFLGDGNTASVGPYKESVAKGAAWLLRQQDPGTGSFGGALEKEASVLTHAWCTLAVSELAFLDRKWPGDEARAAAVHALVSAQRDDGGFGTARATGWAAYALVSAREGGVDIPAEALLRARRALEAKVSIEGDAAHLDAGKVALRCLIGFMVTEAAPAKGDEVLTDVAAARALGQVVRVPDLWPSLDPESRMLVAYAAYQCGGDTWREANKGIKAFVVPKQIKVRGENHGGFPAERGFGVVRATAFGALSLEVYFRFARVLGAR